MASWTGLNRPSAPVFGGAAPPMALPAPRPPNTPDPYAQNGQIVSADPNNSGWFGPADPIKPMAPKDQVAGRAFDYDAAYNISFLPRQDEELSFSDLRGLAEGLDVVKLCIETRKDQLENQQGGVLPKKAPGSDVRGQADDRCAQLEAFFQSPDRKHTWDQWRRMLVHEMLVIDAPAVYIRRTFGGEVYSLDIVDGATIVPKIALDGRAPDPPSTAYQQVLKGVPAVDYTTEELIYLPRNPRVNKLYGYPPVEQLQMSINICIRRDVAKLNYYTEGNIPDTFMPMPADWAPDRIEQFQKVWDAMMSDIRERAGRMKFVPGGGGTPMFIRNDTLLFGQPDEWFARLVAYCFNLSPQAFVQMMNRATGETAQEMANDEGLTPLMRWFKSLMDIIIQKIFGCADLEWVWTDDDLTPAELVDVYLPLADRGFVSGDTIRGKLGMEPIGMPEIVKGLGPWGFLAVSQIIEMIKTGANLVPPQGPAMAGGAPGMPGAPPGVPGGPPQALPPPNGGPTALASEANDPMSNIPPDLLAAVGLGPLGPVGRTIHATSKDEFRADPLSRHVPNPKVLATLRAAEATQRRRETGRRGAQ